MASLNCALPVHAAVSCRRAESVDTKVFVAATLSSGPAFIGKMMSHSAASGLSAAFTMQTVRAPEARALAAISTISALPPDWETARNS